MSGPRPASGRSLAAGAAAVAAATAVALLAVGARSADDAAEPGAGAAPEQLRVRVLATLPHDTEAFTQGLEVREGVLYEGTGRVGRSWVAATELSSGAELARADLPEPLFGEGITLTQDALWQLTWRDGVAVERDPGTLAERRTVRYDGEGWGLCHQQDSDRLVMSDGSDTLQFRDPVSFEPTGEVRVESASGAVEDLNELECVDGAVYANVWHSDTILRIDPDEGRVTAEIDASGLLTADERRAADVLNGIAFSPEHDAFLVTGKLWPHLFVVEFVPG
ncbi:glutaminyl-peptide cyclotransferase [Streptomyces bohaiensis]|uniref:glutaminyl-peptide cyclotransferase n=1 Tax=Streptomyces bohaiensis TaxID=1431344 RepID=UPI0028AA6366|nr:glutaminyl-peptide cyclotransferase [Streptomyces bohaiensis]